MVASRNCPRPPRPTRPFWRSYRALYAYLAPRGGAVMFSALRLRIREGKFREPDVLVLRDREDPRLQDRFWLGADLVAEVVSPVRPERDLVDKRADYAEAGIPEYWIVDPRHDTITVLALAAGAYAERGVYSRGATALSPSLDGLAIDVTAAWNAYQFSVLKGRVINAPSLHR